LARKLVDIGLRQPDLVQQMDVAPNVPVKRGQRSFNGTAKHKTRDWRDDTIAYAPSSLGEKIGYLPTGAESLFIQHGPHSERAPESVLVVGEAAAPICSVATARRPVMSTAEHRPCKVR
jgi:hypothetical protein